MPNLTIPQNYKATLDREEMEVAIEDLRHQFQKHLSETLDLRRVTAPLMVRSNTGINDDLNGVERAVAFPVKDLGDARAEIVHSLAKWKRMKLGSYKIPRGRGIWTDMDAIRADEVMDNAHSIYVDQWDWERTIAAEDRTLSYLEDIVRRIYGAIKKTEKDVHEKYAHITPALPENIVFIQCEDLLAQYPNMTPSERETAAAKEHGAVFLIGIGGALSNGEKHDGRAPDYDDWSTPTSDGKYKGLNGDIIVWNEVLQRGLELSSMGIRVDPEALLRQLEITNKQERKGLLFHRMLLNDELPLSIGGGIGQSRMCMQLLKCAHIGEVSSSLWPDEMIQECAKHGIYLK
eukprot:Blabericola_migrator_1__5798@NODE_2939_length_2187_cov_558_611792_g1843_i0_p1_GENE_NODE_2939_length_2187_cov_558_611792_g1843_i0NODE_2939_length_2187_cov_558_611792_g1843_i0_p1_ORF_typecomplete_len347_score55_32AsnA/PF03590_15/3_5e98tRNAsynt_2/PF00152_20/3_8e03tRNAsynt_2/PF00152_20/3_1e09Orthopox_A5L/PF06193_11/0_23AMPbinding_C/PF13193_6/0_48_NODE_2939_length_2187_cov_558_611792_g1843_i09321972